MWDNAAPTIKVNYAYTYDAADNMLTKTEPFLDDFNDTNYTGWTVSSGTWSAAHGYLAKTNVSGLGKLTKAHTDADGELRFDYRVTDTSTAATARVDLGSHSVGKVYLLITPGTIELKDFLVPTGGTTITLDTVSVGTTEDQWYTIRAEYDGGNVKVWRRTEGGLDTLLLSTTAARVMGTSSTAFSITPDGTDYEFDNIRILSDTLSTTTTFAVNTADELTSATVSTGGTTYFEYDAWGRMSRKYIGTSGSPTFEATYQYKYDDKLVAVTSNFPDEGNVTYEYGADGQRRSRRADGVTTYLNWGPMGPLSEESSSGALMESYIGAFASVTGSNPSSGSYEYFLRDANASVRSGIDSSFLVTSQSAYDPYGDVTDNAGVTPAFAYTGHWREELTGMYFAYHRVLDPAAARWLRQEPTGADGPNPYRYVLNNPVSFFDPDGLSATSAFTSWFGGHSGDWFDRMAEWTGRCVGPPAAILLGVTAPIALVERLGAAELVLLGDINKSWYAPLGKAYPTLMKEVGKGASISVGIGVGIGDLFFDPFEKWTDKMIGPKKVKCPWD